MIRKDSRDPAKYTKADWFRMPRDYRFYVRVDCRGVVEREAREQIVKLLRRVTNIDAIAIQVGLADALPNVPVLTWAANPADDGSGGPADPQDYDTELVEENADTPISPLRGFTTTIPTPSQRFTPEGSS